ncbi:MAG TPA: hypothetical protein VFN21_08905 [Acidimicrobiales bacterium]|nr:hypothetical protein [Acidimicrobiales bacterium]
MSGPTLFAATASVGWSITVLALYALIGIPIVFWGLTRTGKRGLAWVLLPLISAVATIGLWLYVHQQVHA